MAFKFVETLRNSVKNNVYITDCLDNSLYYITLIITLILTLGALMLILVPRCDDNIFTNNLDCRLILTGIIIYSVYGVIFICVICVYFYIRLYKSLIK